MWLFFRLSALLMRIPAILGGSSTADLSAIGQF
jgi:hypothetical protein